MRATSFAFIAAAALIAAGVSAGATAANVKLTVTVAGRGTVTSVPKGIACPKACAKQFAKGKTVKLTPRAAAGSTFSRWTGACAKVKRVCTLKLTAAKRAGAVFADLPPPGFTPLTLAGTWAGTWRNETFGSTGPASIVVTVTNTTTFTFTSTFGGNVFGCSAPPPATGTVTRGSGTNTWDADGFNVDMTTPAGGKVQLTYDFKASSMTGTGQSGCNPAITWRMTAGTFTNTTFNGRIAISLAGNALATSVLELTRS